MYSRYCTLLSTLRVFIINFCLAVRLTVCRLLLELEPAQHGVPHIHASHELGNCGRRLVPAPRHPAGGRVLHRLRQPRQVGDRPAGGPRRPRMVSEAARVLNQPPLCLEVKPVSRVLLVCPINSYTGVRGPLVRGAPKMAGLPVC